MIHKRISTDVSVIIAVVGILLTAACERADKNGNQAENLSDQQTAHLDQNIGATPPSTPSPATNHQQSSALTLVMLGDSLTAGFGLREADTPPAQIEDRLREKSLNVNVINAGVSGDTSAGGLARFDWSVGAAMPDVLLIALGANDYLGGVPPGKTRQNLTAIIERAKTSNAVIVLVGIQPRTSATADPRGAAFGAIYPDLADQFNIHLFPAMLEGVRDNPALLQADGLHPNTEGAAVIAENLTEFLTPLIKSASK